MIVDDAYPAILEEVSSAMRPMEDEEIIVKTEDDQQVEFWKIVDVDFGIALCQSLEHEEQQEEVIHSKFQANSLIQLFRLISECCP